MRNRNAKIIADKTAPNSTAKNIPGRPLYQKKSTKLISSAEPSIIAVVSPTKVAAPCKLEETAIAIIKGTGFVFNFLQISRATGATISTVATLSTNAEIIPAKSAMATAAHLTFGTFSIIKSASNSGILLSMNRATIPIVPAIISKTLKSIAPTILPSGNIPVTIKIKAEPSAIYGLNLLKISIKIYAIAKIAIAPYIIDYHTSFCEPIGFTILYPTLIKWSATRSRPAIVEE